MNEEIISVNQDSLGAGGKRIGYDNTGTCKEVRFYSWLALYVYFKLFLCKKTYQICSKDLEDSSKAVELYNAISDSTFLYGKSLYSLITLPQDSVSLTITVDFSVFKWSTAEMRDLW